MANLACNICDAIRQLSPLSINLTALAHCQPDPHSSAVDNEFNSNESQQLLEQQCCQMSESQSFNSFTQLIEIMVAFEDYYLDFKSSLTNSVPNPVQFAVRLYDFDVVPHQRKYSSHLSIESNIVFSRLELIFHIT